MDELNAILVPMLRQEEGMRLLVYDDFNGKPIGPGTLVQGHPTLGVGRALDVNGISPAEADFLLRNDIARVMAQLDLGLPWWRELSPNRQAVLVAMGFQLGITGLLAFKNTLAMIKAGNYDGAAAGMLNSLWAKQTPDRAKRMAQLMQRG
jgi:lysozyme